MREIKFRGKRIDNNQWVTGYLIVDEVSDKYYIFPNGNGAGETDIIGEEGLLNLFAFEVDSKAIEQYTGLKDKNGVEIYEGDILEDWNGEIAIIEWKEKDAMFVLIIDKDIEMDFGSEISTGWQIIGNKYDNPGLLEKE